MFFGDSFFFPFDNQRPDRQHSRHGRICAAAGKDAVALEEAGRGEGLPADLAGYEEFVRRTMADNQKKGGVAIKFEAAYFRTLYFSDPPRDRPKRSTTSTARAACPRRKNTGYSRIIFFA